MKIFSKINIFVKFILKKGGNFCTIAILFFYLFSEIFYNYRFLFTWTVYCGNKMCVGIFFHVRKIFLWTNFFYKKHSKGNFVIVSQPNWNPATPSGPPTVARHCPHPLLSISSPLSVLRFSLTNQRRRHVGRFRCTGRCLHLAASRTPLSPPASLSLSYLRISEPERSPPPPPSNCRRFRSRKPPLTIVPAEPAPETSTACMWRTGAILLNRSWAGWPTATRATLFHIPIDGKCICRSRSASVGGCWRLWCRRPPGASLARRVKTICGWIFFLH